MAVDNFRKVRGLNVELLAKLRIPAVAFSTQAERRGELAAPDGKSQMKFNFTTSGDGTTVMDLDKGLPRSHLLTSTFVGKMDMPPGAPTAVPPSMNMRGTMNVVVTSK